MRESEIEPACWLLDHGSANQLDAISSCLLVLLGRLRLTVANLAAIRAPDGRLHQAGSIGEFDEVRLKASRLLGRPHSGSRVRAFRPQYGQRDHLHSVA